MRIIIFAVFLGAISGLGSTEIIEKSDGFRNDAFDAESSKFFEASSKIKLERLKSTDGTIELNYPENSVVKYREAFPDNFVNELSDVHEVWGNVTHTFRFYFHIVEMTHLPNHIATMNVTYTFSRIIHGIRLRSFNDSGALGELIGGGINFNFASFRIVGHTNYFLFLFEFFYDPTITTIPPITTTPPPDFEVEHWGTVNARSRLISENRHYYYPGPMSSADKTIGEYPQRTIHAMRLYALNGTRGAFTILNGGLSHDFVIFRFIGESLGRGFDFRLELYENGALSRKLSAILVLLLCSLYFILK